VHSPNPRYTPSQRGTGEADQCLSKVRLSTEDLLIRKATGKAIKTILASQSNYLGFENAAKTERFNGQPAKTTLRKWNDLHPKFIHLRFLLLMLEYHSKCVRSI